MGTSFLTPADVTQIHQVQSDMFATRKALKGISLVLQRPDGLGGYTPRPAQIVVVRFHDRIVRENTAESQDNPLIVGELQHEPPFDVAQDDMFVLSEGQVGTVTHVLFAKQAYVQALFELEERSP